MSAPAASIALPREVDEDLRQLIPISDERGNVVELPQSITVADVHDMRVVRRGRHQRFHDGATPTGRAHEVTNSVDWGKRIASTRCYEGVPEFPEPIDAPPPAL